MPSSSRHQDRSPSRFQRLCLGALSLSLAAASVAHYERDLHLRAQAERFRSGLALDLRWPYVRTVGLQPAGDLAIDVVVQAALQSGPNDLPTSQRLKELREARDLMLEAVAIRPGWAYHWFLLGQVSRATSKLRADAKVPPELWESPLRRGAAAAPGLDAVWAALADAYLENWQELSAATRAEALPVLGRAFLDREVIARSFLPTLALVGRSEAMKLVPDRTGPLGAAAQALANRGDMAGVAGMMARMEKAERDERVQGLRKIEERYRLGDREGLRSACLAWFSAHPTADLDDGPGRSQAARVLDLWPSDRTGSWGNDDRGELVRFFLDGRESDVKGEAMARALESLSGVPEVVSARVRLLTGNIEGAEELAGKFEDGNSPEWASYLVQLARFEMKRGRAREAQKALGRIGPVAREECDVLLARRDVARAVRDGAEVGAAQQTLESVRRSAESAEAAPGSPEVVLSFCLDPEWAVGRTLTVEIEVSAPAVLVYGWDGSRSGTLFASETSTILRVPLMGPGGTRSFSVRAAAGGPIREVRAAVIIPTN